MVGSRSSPLSYLTKREGFGRNAHKPVHQPSGLRKQTSQEVASNPDVSNDSPLKHASPPSQSQSQSQSPSQSCADTRTATTKTNEFKDVMCLDFVLRTDGSQEKCSKANASPVARLQAAIWRILGYIMPDVVFALRPSSSGGWRGKPGGLYELYDAPYDAPGKLGSFCEEELADAVKDPETRSRMHKFLGRMRGFTDMRAVRFLGWFLPKIWRTCFAHIFVNYSKLASVREQFRKAAEEGKAVLVLPTHRSHIDYLLLSYVCYGFDLPLPHIAAGENLNIPVVGPLFAAAGAFFMKRSMKGEDLYKKVFQTYMLHRLKEGQAVEFFLQGGRTRTGQISDPKLGLVSMVVRMVRQKRLKDVVVFPISIDYDRTLEGESYANNLLGQKKQKESLTGVLKSGAQLVSKAVHGNAYVNFAESVSLQEVMDKVDEELLAKNKVAQIGDYTVAIGQALVQEQRDVSVIGDTAVVAAVLLSLSEEDLFKQSICERIEHRAEWLKELLALNNTPVVSVASDTSPAPVHDALTVLFPVFQPFRKYRKTRWSKSKPIEEKDLALLLAKARLKLRYSCGQLPVILTPLAVAATALQCCLRDRTSTKRGVGLQWVVNKSKEIARVVKFYMPGSDISSKRLREAVKCLCSSLGVEVVNGETLQVTESQELEEKLRVLFTIISPCLSAAYALLLSLFTLVEKDQDFGGLSEEELVRKCKETLHEQFQTSLSEGLKNRVETRSEITGESDSTDVRSLPDMDADDHSDSDMSDGIFGIGLTDISLLEDEALFQENEYEEMIVAYGTPIPDALSSSDILAAIKYLRHAKVLERSEDVRGQTPIPLLNRPVSSMTSVRSVAKSLSEISSKASMADLKGSGVEANKGGSADEVLYNVAMCQREENGQLIWNKLNLLRSYTAHFKEIAISPGALFSVVEASRAATGKPKSIFNISWGRVFNSYTLLLAVVASKLMRIARLRQQRLQLLH